MSKEIRIGVNPELFVARQAIPGDAAVLARMDLIPFVIFNLEQMEFGRKPLEAKLQLRQRLAELAQGREVPVVVFNCLEFSWQQNGNKYPKSVVSGDARTAIAGYFQDEIQLVTLELQAIGKPALKVVVPDSELFDDRVFSFVQTAQERNAVAAQVRADLTDSLSDLNLPESPVILWSEYCQEQGLLSPREYTEQNYLKIKSDPKLLKKVQEQVRDSQKYFEKNGLFQANIAKVNEGEIIQRVAWYCAMYAGEGQALADSGAIVLNFEDRRVPTWFQRGAEEILPILNPGDPFAFYAWRRNLKTEQS